MKSSTTSGTGLTITVTGFTLIADHGEGQIVVLASGGQSGHIAIHVAQTGVDGGYCMPVGHSTFVDFPYGTVKCSEARQVVEHAVKHVMPFSSAEVWAEEIGEAFQKHFIDFEG